MTYARLAEDAVAVGASSWGPEAGPTILVVGDPDARSLAVRLAARGLRVESTPTHLAEDAASELAPDGIVLVGDAADDGGERVSELLAESAAVATCPILVLGGDDRPHGDYGIIGSLRGSLSSDEIADDVITLLRAVADRREVKHRTLGETLDDVVALAFTPGRRGVLTVRAADRACAGALSRGAIPVPALERLLSHVAPLAVRDEDAWVSFRELPAGRVGVVPSDVGAPGASLAGVRVVVLEPSSAPATDLSRTLRSAGASVLVVDAGGAGVGRARSLAPDVIVLDGRALDDAASPAMSAIVSDRRLSWASMLVTREEDVRTLGRDTRDSELLTIAVRRLVAADDRVTDRALKSPRFAARLESTGPLRLVRALLRTSRHLLVEVAHPRVRVELELERDLVIGARATSREGEQVVGAAALATFLELASGRAVISTCETPTLPNVMSRLDDALAAALRERPLGRPVSGSARESSPAPAGPVRVPARELVARLTAKLQEIAPPATTASTLPAPPIPAVVAPAAVAPAPAAIVSAPPPRSSALVAILTFAALFVLAFGAWTAVRVETAAPIAAASIEERAVARITVAEAPAPRRASEDRAHERRAQTTASSLEAELDTAELEAAEIDSETLETMLTLGGAARRRGDFGTAERYYLDVTAIDPTNGRALVGLVRVAESRGDLAEAVRYATALVDTRPDHPANFILLGDLRAANGDVDGARAAFEAALELFPRNEIARERLAALRR
jgi:cytochrome c-type biogenesis protein CcmH/NrfG/CheY-like chemotaxis protein